MPAIGPDPRPSPLNIDAIRTAVLVLHCQVDIVAGVTSGIKPSAGAELVERAATVLNGCRQAGIAVINVVAQLRPSYPEVSPRNKVFSALMRAGRMQEGTEGAQIHPRLAPQSGDVVVTGRRVNAFIASDLESILRARDITTLVLMGINTQGTVLSTLRYAADVDYDLIVLEDCCADSDDEVHRVLIEKVFPLQATVVSSREFLAALGQA